MKTAELKAAVLGGAFDQRFTYIYGEAALNAQKMRYAAAIDSFVDVYGADREVALYSVAGRSELSGNHTDHNHGCVVAASIDLDIIAVASPSEGSVIRVKSEGFPEDIVDISTFTSPREFPKGHILHARQLCLLGSCPHTCSRAREFPPLPHLRT